MGKGTKFSPEVRERAVRLVGEQRGEHESEWATICAVSAKIGCWEEALRRWVWQAERDRVERSGLTADELARLEELKRENRELKKANKILSLASAYSARAELDRRQK